MIKCKMCGGDLILEAGKSIAECEYCGSVQTVPSADNEKKLTLFGRANRLRASCDFDKAASIYESIVAEVPGEAEAYWGLVLCKYGIEYVDDPATGKKIPTCHRSSYDCVMEDSNLEQAVENADVVAQKVYRQEAKDIEQIRKGILEVSSQEAPYDIFICYKETDETGGRTLDSVIAQDMYDALTDKGYRVFFSRITLEDKLGEAYEPYIFAALNSAKVMLAVGTCFEYYNAVWVKNEWSRYLKLMEKDKSKHLIPCFKGIDAYDMPKEFNKLQAQDLGKVGAIQDLLRGIDKLISVKPAAAPAAAGMQTDDVNRIYIYNSALEAMNNKKVKKAKEAVKKLESLGNWGDAPQQLEKAKKHLKNRKGARTVRRIIIWVLILSIIGGIVGLVAYENYQTKKNRYESAMNFMANEDYQNAYNYFLKAENYEDAPQKAEEAKKLMNDLGRKLIKDAEKLNEMGYYMVAGIYLEQSMSNANSISSEDQNRIFEMINDNFTTGEEQVAAWYENAQKEIDVSILEEYEMMFQVMMEAGAYAEFFTSLVDWGIAETDFAVEFIRRALEEENMLDYLKSLEDLASYVPEALMPVLDMSIINTEKGIHYIDSSFLFNE